jgi:transposase-like protein
MPRDPATPRPVRRPAARRLATLLPQLRDLGQRERLQACCFMSSLVNGENTAALINQARRPFLACPDCRQTAINRCGVANGMQRYRCKQCSRTFNALTGTPLARLRLKTRWLAYFECLRDPACTVNSAAQQVDVHPNTSFRWRHRFLAWTKRDRPARLHGVAEINDATLRESQKGSRRMTRPPRNHGRLSRHHTGEPAAARPAHRIAIVTARDRAGNTIDFIGGSVPLRARTLHQHLPHILADDVLLVSGAKPVYRRFARRAEIAHRFATSNRPRAVKAYVFHTNNVIDYQQRFKSWLAHFRGVATRYLDNYLGWRWAIDRDRIGSAQRFLRAALGVFTT